MVKNTKRLIDGRGKNRIVDFMEKYLWKSLWKLEKK
jgi:hypothetical protein